MSNLIWGTERGKKREEVGMQMGWREKGQAKPLALRPSLGIILKVMEKL